MRSFKLSDKFLEQYKGRQPKWGPLGFVTYKRTYARTKPDGTTEEFWETVCRVVEGTYNIQKDHCKQLGVEWNNDKAQNSAQEMFRRIWDFKFLPPGRGLWMMGTETLEKHSGALFNCAYRATDDLHVDLAEPFCWVMEFLMLGCGCGFGSEGAGTVVIKQPARSADPFMVPDTREGWVAALRAVIYPFSGKGSLPASFDYSQVRPAGEPIKGFGGIASGPDPLKELLTDVEKILTKRIGQKITVTDINDIMNLVGRCVVSGNVRRSAEISLGNADDQEFLNLKNPVTNHERLMHHGWASNNSVFAKVGIAYETIAEMAAKNGEPGAVWLDTCRKYGRLKDAPDNKDYRVSGVNPCQPEFATVLTPVGIRTFKDINVGDEIWSGKRWTKVVNKWSTGIKQVNEYHTRAGVFIGTENHRVLQRGEKIEVHNAESIDTAQGPYQSYVHDDVDVVDGLVVGDGGPAGGGSNIVVLYVGNDDQDYFTSNISKFIGNIYSEQKNCYKVSTSLEAHELTAMPVRQIPERFFKGSPTKVAGFLRGLYSAKGSVVRNRVALKVSSFEMILQIQQMLSSLGIKSYYTTNKPHDVEFSNGAYECKQSYDLNISTDLDKFRKLIGFIQQYKQEKLDKIVGSQGSPKLTYDIVESKYLGEHEVFDITVEDQDHTYWTGGLLVSNCGEQTLENGECCCLVEVFPSNHDNYKDYEVTLKYAYLYGKTVTLLKTHSPLTNAVMQRNRRIGTSNSGIVQAVNKFGRREFFNMCDMGYTYLQELDKQYSEWFCIPRSIKMTTVKPSGTTSLLSGNTPGIHFPHSEYYIRRIRFQESSSMVPVFRKHGYKVEKDSYSPNTVCVEFPVHEKYFTRSKYDVTLWEQLEMAAAMQYYWSDNAVSITVTVKPEEAKDIKYAMELYESRLKTVSFLPLEDHKYVQAPYETITKEQYESMVAAIAPIDSFDDKTHEVTEMYCTTDVCELKSRT